MSSPVVAPRLPVAPLRDCWVCFDRPRERLLLRVGYGGDTLPVDLSDLVKLTPLHPADPLADSGLPGRLWQLFHSPWSVDWTRLSDSDERVTVEPGWYARTLARLPERKRKRPEPVRVEVSV